MKTTSVQGRVPTSARLPSMIATNLLMFVSAAGASHQSEIMQQELGRVSTHYESTAWSRRSRRREQFERLASRWREDTQWLSSTTEIAMHPAYQAIIGMGSEAIPMILNDLRLNTGYWYWALKAITQADPVPPENRGRIKLMKEAWLRWGEQLGITSE